MKDLQIFYSFIVLNNKEVYYNLPKLIKREFSIIVLQFSSN